MSGATTMPEPQAHVLFAVLDWGIGHATRTWPLIVAARRCGARVTVASRGVAGAWLDARMAAWDTRDEAASLHPWQRVEKPGVTIRYGRGWSTLMRIGLQMPGFLASIRRERQWIRTCVERHGITHVLSDNCYGCHPAGTGAHSVFMSHQLNPPVPGIIRPLARHLVRRFSGAYHEVWIPDTPDHALAGRLSMTSLPNARWIGPLSRFQVEPDAVTGTATAGASAADDIALLGVVSGPEPQRTAMESALRTCFLNDGRPALLLAGKPGGQANTEGNLLTLCDADDQRFAQAVKSATCIVCRSGYSTLMDLVVLGRTAILVPTIGQPEQEQLARRWADQHGWAMLSTPEIAGYTPSAPPGMPVKSAAAGPENRIRHWLRNTVGRNSDAAHPKPNTT